VSMKYCEFLLDNYHIVDNYINEVIKEKNKVVSMLKNYEVVDFDTPQEADGDLLGEVYE